MNEREEGGEHGAGSMAHPRDVHVHLHHPTEPRPPHGRRQQAPFACMRKLNRYAPNPPPVMRDPSTPGTFIASLTRKSSSSHDT